MLNVHKFSSDPLRRLLQRIERQRDQWKRRQPAEDLQPQAAGTTGSGCLSFIACVADKLNPGVVGLVRLQRRRILYYELIIY